MALKLSTPAGRGNQRDTITFTSNYGDFLNGNKWMQYYFGTEDSASQLNPLWHTTFNSKDSSTNADLSSTDFTKEIEIDFDLTINANRLIGGDFLLINKVKRGYGIGHTVDVYMILKLIHYGSTETILATVQSRTMTTTTAGGNGSTTETITLKGTMTNKSFKKGDILRLRLEGWGKENSNDPLNNMGIFHNADSTSTIYLPFARLDEF